ncbi:polysaccharide pyruvyl transferase family protein [Mesorhizobium sp. SB112]|uniref:polysaccharide pyruvyl transferase family protein n=1 Tax=Mesorhizobium sp. SB112 TaxID=3151853 RepID=UPI0032640199
MKVGLLGQFGSGNSGNDGSLEAVVQFLRRTRPEDELVCICSNPEVVEKNLDVQAISITAAEHQGRVFRFFDKILFGVPRRLRNVMFSITTTSEFNAIIVPGTGILDDFQENPFGWPYVLFRWCLAAFLGGTQLAFVSVGAGPVNRHLSRWFIKRAAGFANYRSYRDQASLRFMQSIGFENRDDRIFPDVAFGLAAPKNEFQREGSPVIGVGVMSYHGWSKNAADRETIHHTYIEKLRIFIVWLVQNGYRVRILTGDAQDWRAVEELQKALVASLPDTSAIIAEQATDLHLLMAQIQQTDIIVATRFHNVVCALKLGRPTISIGYSSKNDQLLEDMALGHFCQHIETFEVEILKRQLDAMMQERESIAKNIQRRVEIYSQRLAMQESILLQTVLAKKPSNENAFLTEAVEPESTS